MPTLRRGLLAALAAVMVGSGALLAADAPIELGQVRWGRDHAAGVAASKNSGKPLLVLFQEVPG